MNLSTLNWGTKSGIAYNAVLDVQFSAENATEPVTLQEAKDWCKIDIPDDDVLITSLITAARIICEQHSNTSFITRTVSARLNNGLGGMYLPYGPVTGNLISILDDDSVAIDTNNFSVRNASFKQLYTPFNSIITVSYTAGYEVLPWNLRVALLNQIAWMYENRGDSTVAGKLSEQAKLILNSVRRV